MTPAPNALVEVEPAACKARNTNNAAYELEMLRPIHAPAETRDVIMYNGRRPWLSPNVPHNEGVSPCKIKNVVTERLIAWTDTFKSAAMAGMAGVYNSELRGLIIPAKQTRATIDFLCNEEKTL